MNTQRKGDIAVTKAISKFTEMGWDVLLPITESAQYDLVVDVEGQLKRVQVKYFGAKDVNPYLRLRRIHSNSKGYVVKHYDKEDVDWFYLYCKDGREFLIKEIPSDVKNQYTPKEYELI